MRLRCESPNSAQHHVKRLPGPQRAWMTAAIAQEYAVAQAQAARWQLVIRMDLAQMRAQALAVAHRVPV